MTLEKYIQENMENKIVIIKKKLSRRFFAKFLRQFEYVDTCYYWFDDDENPNINNWIDVEGIGYGWLWLSYKNSKKKQRKAIIKYAKGLYEDSKNKMAHEFHNNIHYFWLESKPGDAIILIRCSHNELNGW